MKTFSFAEKNGNAVVIISAEDQAEAGAYLSEIVKHPREFRCEVVDENEELG